MLAQRFHFQPSEVRRMPTSQRKRLVNVVLGIADLEYRHHIGDASVKK